jgi:uncharacterized protein (DUF2147 family)
MKPAAIFTKSCRTWRPETLRLASWIIGIVVLWANGSQAHSASVAGEWLVADKSARIMIHACGNRLRGVIAWERVHGLDDQNPDPAKRHRPTLGLSILRGMQSTGSDSWAGQIYNADNGKTCAAKLKLLSSNALRVEGCVMGFLCAGETWTKVREHSEECPATPPAPPPAPPPAKGQ